MSLNNIVSSITRNPVINTSSSSLSSSMINLDAITHTVNPGGETIVSTITINSLPEGSRSIEGSSRQLFQLHAMLNVSNNFPRATCFLKRTRDSVVTTVMATGSIDNSDPPVAANVHGTIIGSGGGFGGTSSFIPFFCTAIDDVKIGDTYDLVFASAAVTTINAHSGHISPMAITHPS
tara:strand:+ start:710 stop:1243 length:534 start_codon:yes stop_codon:yes gene_type:complete